MEDAPNYELASSAGGEIPAPDLPYRPREPRAFPPRIALIGCGGISETHLSAYRDAGYDVVALCDRTLSKAVGRRDAFCPAAEVTTDPAAVFAREDLSAVDLTPHPADRAPLVEAALAAGQVVLSQKPLAASLAEALRLVELAERSSGTLAVNQNGRFAPHFAWMREAVRAGLIGDVTAIRIGVQWDHNWIAGLPFDEDPHVILSDFGIHWFDFVASVIGPAKPGRVTAFETRTRSQRAKPPLCAHVALELGGAQVSLDFDGDTRHGGLDRTVIVGTRGLIESTGPPLEDQRVTAWTADGVMRPHLTGRWFPDAFRAAMAELLCAVEDGREPLHGARENLRSLELCQAALAATARS